MGGELDPGVSERKLEVVCAMRREVDGSDIEACGESVTWWVGILVSGQQYGLPCYLESRGLSL